MAKHIVDNIKSLFNSGVQDILVAIKDIDHYYKYGDITYTEAVNLKKYITKDIKDLARKIQEL